MKDEIIVALQDEIRREKQQECLRWKETEITILEFLIRVADLRVISSKLPKPKGLFEKRCPNCGTKLHLQQKDKARCYSDEGSFNCWHEVFKRWTCLECEYEYGDIENYHASSIEEHKERLRLMSGYYNG